MKKDKKKILKWTKSQEIYGTKLEFPVVKNRSLRRKKKRRKEKGKERIFKKTKTKKPILKGHKFTKKREKETHT